MEMLIKPCMLIGYSHFAKKYIVFLRHVEVLLLTWVGHIKKVDQFVLCITIVSLSVYVMIYSFG